MLLCEGDIHERDDGRRSKRWTARRKSALVLEMIQGKTTVSEASRQFDLAPPEIKEWMGYARAGMENALRAKPEDGRE